MLWIGKIEYVIYLYFLLFGLLCDIFFSKKERILFDDLSNGFYLWLRSKNKIFEFKVSVCWDISFLNILRCVNF